MVQGYTVVSGVSKENRGWSELMEKVSIIDSRSGHSLKAGAGLHLRKFGGNLACQNPLNSYDNAVCKKN